MSMMNTRFIVGGLLLSAIASTGCDVSVGECEKDDAGECVDLFPDDPDGSVTNPLDGSLKDGAVEASTATDGGVDGATAADATAPDASGAPLTLNQFCDQQLVTAIAWRDIFDKCCVTQPQDVTAFLGSVVAYVEDAHGKCVAARSTMSVTFDGSKAAACATEYLKGFDIPGAECPIAGFDLRMLESTIGHGSQSLAQIPACREAFKGSVKQGQPCTDALECASGLRCAGEGTSKTCQTTVASGGSCFGDGECADGLTCVGSNATGGKQCRSLAPSLGKCSRSKECEKGLLCDTTSGSCVTATASTPVCK